jgi:hypothetical protein
MDDRGKTAFVVGAERYTLQGPWAMSSAIEHLAPGEHQLHWALQFSSCDSGQGHIGPSSQGRAKGTSDVGTNDLNLVWLQSKYGRDLRRLVCDELALTPTALTGHPATRQQLRGGSM